MSENKIIEKDFKILELNKKNKNHRIYPTSVIQSWISSEQNDENKIIELEYAIDGVDESGETFQRDILQEFIVSSLSVGIVYNLRIEKNCLYATVKLKLPEYCNDLTKEFYENPLILNHCSIVPKGKGSVKSQTIQDDYELYGFNLILKEESPFEEESSEAKENIF